MHPLSVAAIGFLAGPHLTKLAAKALNSVDWRIQQKILPRSLYKFKLECMGFVQADRDIQRFIQVIYPDNIISSVSLSVCIWGITPFQWMGIPLIITFHLVMSFGLISVVDFIRYKIACCLPISIAGCIAPSDFFDLIPDNNSTNNYEFGNFLKKNVQELVENRGKLIPCRFTEDEELMKNFCHLTMWPIRHPVRALDGLLYEEFAIKMWLQDHATSPFYKRLKMTEEDLQPDHELEGQIIARIRYLEFME